MTGAVGFSHLYPAVPIMNFFAMVSMLLLVPAFWKTRIVALVALVGWLFVANLINFIGMIHWRGHTNDALVLASICESSVSSSNKT
jgi:Pheromone A receptor